jgi:hypothetical protein
VHTGDPRFLLFLLLTKEYSIILLLISYFEGLLNWLQKRRLEKERFFSVIFVVLDMLTKSPLKNVKNIAEHTRAHAALK